MTLTETAINYLTRHKAIDPKHGTYTWEPADETHPTPYAEALRRATDWYGPWPSSTMGDGTGARTTTSDTTTERHALNPPHWTSTALDELNRCATALVGGRLFTPLTANAIATAPQWALTRWIGCIDRINATTGDNPTKAAAIFCANPACAVPLTTGQIHDGRCKLCATHRRLTGSDRPQWLVRHDAGLLGAGRCDVCGVTCTGELNDRLRPIDDHQRACNACRLRHQRATA